jgi:hypothetical protein
MAQALPCAAAEDTRPAARRIRFDRDLGGSRRPENRPPRSGHSDALGSDKHSANVRSGLASEITQ